MNTKKNEFQNKQRIVNSPKIGIQHVVNEALALNNIPSLVPQDKSKVINNPDIYLQQDFYTVSLSYNINQLVKPNIQDDEAYPILIFKIMEFLEIDLKNIFTLLLHTTNYIRNKKVEKGKINDIFELKGFNKAA